MVAEVRVENGYIKTYDENGSLIYEFGGPYQKQAILGSDKIFSLREGPMLNEYEHNGMLIRETPTMVEKILQVSENTIIGQDANGQIYEYENGMMTKSYWG